MLQKWDDLSFWSSGEWDVVQEHLDDLSKEGVQYCPKREDLFAALDATPFDKVKVVILGQDPYPDPKYATGLAFSIPKKEKDFPPTLKTIFKELESDLDCASPAAGDLSLWAEQGVLLWNVIPSCTVGHSLSHDWPEWDCLTAEILGALGTKDVVYAALGSRARDAAKYINPWDNVIFTSHPSPRGNLKSNNPFSGSKLFSKINSHLKELGKDTIEWRL